MAKLTEVISKLVKLKEEYIEDKPPQPLNAEFRDTVRFISKRLSLMDITYGGFNQEFIKPNYGIAATLAAEVMDYFHKVDRLIPLNVSDHHLYLELGYLTKCLENIILSNELIDGSTSIKTKFYLRSSDEYFIDNYNSDLEYFKKNNNEEEVKIIRENFTNFLSEHIKILSKLKDMVQENEPDILFEKDIDIFVEVGVPEILLETMHLISNSIPLNKMISLCKRLTNFCIKNNFDLQKCKFVQVTEKVYRLEITIMSYFGLKYICQQLDKHKLHQTSQMLSMFSLEEMITSANNSILSIINSGNHGYFTNGFMDTCQESYEHITFNTHEKINVISSNKIKKALLIVKLLHNSLAALKLVHLISDRIQHFPFTPILLSVLSELIMVTDLSNLSDRSNISALIDLIIVCVDVSETPHDFSVINYGFQIYKKCKSDHELRLKSLKLCKHITLSLNTTAPNSYKLININFKQFFNSEEDTVDKLVVMSYSLKDCGMNILKYLSLRNVIYLFNEEVMLTFQHSTKLNPRLLLPYSVSLRLSILNKNEDCIVNNLVMCEDFIAILFNEYQNIHLEEKSYFIKSILENHKIIAHCIPNNFYDKCLEYILHPQNMDLNISLELCNLCSAESFCNFINLLKTETIKIIQANEPMNEDYYQNIYQLWSSLLNSTYTKQKRCFRTEQIHHFCYILKRTFLFNTRKIKTEFGLIVLYRLVALLLHLPWIHKCQIAYFTFKIISYAEKRKVIKNVEVLTQAIELLIIFRDFCPSEEAFKPYLGLYLSSMASLVKTSWSFATRCFQTDKVVDPVLYTPFHKLEKCSNLLKKDRPEQYSYIIHYTIIELLDLIAIKDTLPEYFMKIVYNIIFNMMDTCTPDEFKMLRLQIQGQTLNILKYAYNEYKANVRYTGRL